MHVCFSDCLPFSLPVSGLSDEHNVATRYKKPSCTSAAYTINDNKNTHIFKQTSVSSYMHIQTVHFQQKTWPRTIVHLWQKADLWNGI